jgi:hypothetical protein
MSWNKMHSHPAENRSWKAPRLLDLRQIHFQQAITGQLRVSNLELARSSEFGTGCRLSGSRLSGSRLLGTA